MKIVLAMPHAGMIEAGAAFSFQKPSADPKKHVYLVDARNSSLPSCFNDPFCLALNLRDAGKCTHFAMQHSDIRSVNGWLDILADVMVETGAAVVSTVVAIKQNVPDPTVSTGVGKVADRWTTRAFRRSDYHCLPETFGTADVCEPDELLLINTGLWLADLSHPTWDTFPGFAQFHKIGRDPATQQWRGWQRTEDWELSYHLHETGAPYVATWRVPAWHMGYTEWFNRPEEETETEG